MCRRIAGCFVFLLLLAVAGMAFLYYDLSRPDRHTASGAAPPPPAEERRTARNAIKRIEREYRRAPGTDRKLRMRITEEEANAMLRTTPGVQMALERGRISDLKVTFEPGHLVAGARVPVTGGFEARVIATGTVGVENGKLTYHTEDVRLGSLPTPKPLRQALDTQLARGVEQLNREIQGHVERVEITQGALEVEGTR